MRALIDKTTVVGPFQCNCRLIVCPSTSEGFLVDPGDEPEKIQTMLKEAEAELGQPIKLKALLHTHGHLDHIAATRAVAESFETEVPQIYLHKGDLELYQNLKMQGDFFGMTLADPLNVDQYFEDGQELQFGDLKLSIVHTPGHSPGSVCLRLHENSDVGADERLFSGDTLFKGSVGRTDLWGGNSDQMFKNIRERIFSLEDEIKVCPGHGPETQIGLEKRENPFFK